MRVEKLLPPALQAVIVAVLFAQATFCALFVVPYQFPPRQRLWSASFAFGYNNRVAVLGLAALLVLAALLLWSNRTTEPQRDFPLELPVADRGAARLTLLAMILVYAAATFTAYLIYEG